MKHAITLLVTLAVCAGPALAQTSARRDPETIRVRPRMLALMIDELGGREVSLLRAKIVAVLGSQALLVESAGGLDALPGFYDRIVVLVRDGTIRVAPSLLVGGTVDVAGVARTILGMRVNREVPWPTELTEDVIRRYEIRAAILTSTVQTSDGIELVTAVVAEPGAGGGER